ncbi:MAG: glycine cleavage T C-terminal barrel domain-containing protein [Pirellula sp.]
MPCGYRLGKATIIRFQGKDRCRVVNNLCTQDLRKLSSGQAAETFVTDVKGRTVGHGIACEIGDEIFFVTVPGQADRLVPHFDRYIIREDAIISDQSDAKEIWLFQDRASAAMAFDVSIDQTPDIRRAAILTIDEKTVLLIHAAWIGETSLIALVPPDLSESVKHRLGSDWVDSDLDVRKEWEAKRIRAFWPWYGVDMDDRNLPQELDRNDQAISFNKGCYLGQETIARLDALGQVQKKLVRLRIDSSLVPHAESTLHKDGKEVGWIRSAAMDEDSRTCIALGYVKRSHFQSGQALEINESTASVL